MEPFEITGTTPNSNEMIEWVKQGGTEESYLDKFHWEEHPPKIEKSSWNPLLQCQNDRVANDFFTNFMREVRDDPDCLVGAARGRLSSPSRPFVPIIRKLGNHTLRVDCPQNLEFWLEIDLCKLMSFLSEQEESDISYDDE